LFDDPVINRIRVAGILQFVDECGTDDFPFGMRKRSKASKPWTFMVFMQICG